MPANDVLRQRLHTAANVLNSHRILVYSFASTTAVLAVVVNALKNYSNFYSVAIYLSKSSRSVLALANFCFLVALLCGHLVQQVFFGPLRANEVERLYDRLWFFITESLLAFTIFRDEFDTSFAFMFGFLLFVKSFHWLASDRIEWMDQRPYPGPPLLFHARMVVLFALLWATDCILFIFTIEHTLTVGVGGMVLFASEYGILIASVMNTISKYLLSAFDLRRAGQRGGENAPPWENKSMWTFYIELVTDFMKLSVYLVFFTIILTFYGLPLNIVRDVYMTARSFITRLRALHQYQRATKNMDQRYPNASEEELTAMSDRTCIICREEMVFQDVQRENNGNEGPNMTPKKLPCGHIFHFHCLRSWLERQQSCPTCRRTVLDDHVPLQAGNIPPVGGGFQAGNGPLPPNVNQQGGNNNLLGNPLGFMNRVFGPPNQAQNNNQIPQNQFAPHQAAANRPEQGAPPAVLIQYEVQYQGQRPQPANRQANQPQNLNDVPRYLGHMGPNGVWQPWPLNEEALQRPTNPPVTPSQQTPPTSLQQPDTSQAFAASDSDSDSDSSADEAPLLAPASAREAAREAALRRFGNNTSSSQNSSVPPTTPTPTPTTTVRPPSSSQPAQTESPSRNPVAPSLIPVYDLVFSSDPHEIPSMACTPGSFSGPGLLPYGLQSARLDRSQLTASQTPFADSRSLGITSSHVSEEQLATLDQLTREAIDERLRVLEGVSNTVYRCIGDLMRVRSALPPPNSMSRIPRPQAENNNGAPSTSRRDQKQRETPSPILAEAHQLSGSNDR